MLIPQINNEWTFSWIILGPPVKVIDYWMNLGCLCLCKSTLSLHVVLVVVELVLFDNYLVELMGNLAWVIQMSIVTGWCWCNMDATCIFIWLSILTYDCIWGQRPQFNWKDFMMRDKFRILWILLYFPCSSMITLILLVFVFESTSK